MDFYDSADRGNTSAASTRQGVKCFFVAWNILVIMLSNCKQQTHINLFLFCMCMGELAYVCICVCMYKNN